ncbi:MAG TPA: CoA transferase [Xanthobacteraceae bacterium]|nr:CoA transferase [Xanthobacteraceae bacterium]
MLPLDGVKVVETASNIAGPYAGLILAALGADVLKVERPEGDDARAWGPPFIGDTASIFHTVNLNKRSVALDLKDAAHLAWLKGYIADADVLVQNMRPGAMEALGLGSVAMLALNPRLVYGSVAAFGAKGPMRLNAGYEPMVQAFAGIFSVNGEAERPGVRVGVSLLDIGTGMWTALGCIAGLLQRERTGKGVVVDASLFETALGWLAGHFAGFRVSGDLPVRNPTGSNRVVVFQAFDAADGQIIIAAANDRLFAKLAAELGHPEWANDPRFRTNPDRFAHREVLIPMVAEIVKARPRAHWIERLEAVGVPCAPINDLRQVEALAQTSALGIMQRAPEVAIDFVGLPLSFDGERPPMRMRAPKLGEHNHAVKTSARTRDRARVV